MILNQLHFTDYPGTRSLKLITDFVDHNMTTNDTSIPDVLEKNLASVNGDFLVLFHIKDC